MITGIDMYRKSLRVLSGLESRIADGLATDTEAQRAATIRDHVLAYEWSTDDRPAELLLTALRSREPAVLAFCDWWERVAFSPRWEPDGWRVGLLYWWHPRGPESLTEQLAAEVEREIDARGLAYSDCDRRIAA